MLDKGGITVTGILTLILTVMLGGLIYFIILLPQWVGFTVSAGFIVSSVLLLRYMGKE